MGVVSGAECSHNFSPMAVSGVSPLVVIFVLHRWDTYDRMQ